MKRATLSRTRLTALPALVALLTILSIPGGAVGQEAERLAGGEEWKTDFSQHTVPLEEIVSGGPPKDGIPAIDEPRFVTVDEADDWIDDREPVIVVEHDGDAGAYPYQILTYHEIVNDEVGGLPLTVTFCPLCNTALVFRREHDGRILDFGTTGRLRRSDLVMYDRQTESWWQQATGEAIVGELAGDELTFYPSQTASWEAFKEEHPDGRILSRETGYNRPYGRNPYAGYDTRTNPILAFLAREPDDRLPVMERVAALTALETPVAYPFSRLGEERVVNDEIEGEPVVVFWASGTASALDDSDISQGRDVGATGVFSRRVDGRTLTFEPAGAEHFRDRETESTWNLFGRALEGPMEGTELEPVRHGDYLWFAWAAFRPDTEIRR